MDHNRRHLLGAALLAPVSGARAAGCGTAPPFDYRLPMAPGRFAPTAASLRQYVTPSWFRDAKFGIWAHWGPQAVPRAGDWYARQMYIPGHPHYDHHLRHYGHPSEVGYKDIIPLWRAEKFDPAALMARYKAAGARYFVSMGVHHDNFDLWNSRHHRWNAVAMGPRRDIVGDWRRAALAAGLRFGVSEHLGPSYAWFHPSHHWDQVPPRGGVAYDGADPAFADLYHPPHDEPFRWGRSWYAQNPAWHQRWFDRITDLLDSYQPDFLYTDGGLPFEQVGRTMLAHFYNSNAARHGRLEAVYAYKDLGTGEFWKEAGVEDVERGVMAGINPLPWQTDTSIGDWFYSDGYRYKSTADVVHQLADVVSKNGNLLLNVVLYADGSLPPESAAFLDEMADWMGVNGEAIHDSRPWTVFGEGPTETRTGAFQEAGGYTPADVRYTVKGDTLYAVTLGVPAGQVALTALAADGSTSRVTRVDLLGWGAPLAFAQHDRALLVDLPPAATIRHAAVLRLTRRNVS